MTQNSTRSNPLTTPYELTIDQLMADDPEEPGNLTGGSNNPLFNYLLDVSPRDFRS